MINPPPSTRALVSVELVNYASLPGGNPGFGFEEGDGAAGEQQGRRRRSRRAHARRHRQPARGQICDPPGSDPVEVPQVYARRRQSLTRADDHARCRCVERDHIERLGRRDSQPAPLPDRIMQDAGMAPEHTSVDMDDLARLGRAGQQPLDHRAVMARRDETDVLAVRLVRDLEREFPCERANSVLGQGAEREAQHRQLLAGRREQKIALIAIGIGRAVERPPALAIVGVDDVMAGRQQIGAENPWRPRTDRRTSCTGCTRRMESASRPRYRRERTARSLSRGSALRSRARNAADRDAPRRRGRRECPDRRSMHPCDASRRRDRRAASSARRHRNLRAPAAPPRRWSPRPPTSRRQRACPRAPWAGSASSTRAAKRRGRVTRPGSSSPSQNLWARDTRSGGGCPVKQGP